MLGNVNRDWFLKLKKLGLTLSLSMTCFSCASGISNISIGKLAKVSENVRASIISDNLGFYDSSDCFNHQDKNINTSSLKDIYILRIDGSCCGDLSFLEGCSNLEFMIVNNFNCLSEENLEYLSKLPKLNKLYINVDTDYLLKNPNYKLDLDMLSNVENIYLFSNDKSDIAKFLIYNIGANYYNTSRSNIFDKYMNEYEISKVIDWDKKFDDMLNDIPIDDNTSEEDKIMQIVYFVNKYYSYDDKVSEYLDNGVESKEVNNLVLYYNAYHIDPIFGESKEGICSNFATFTNILCYKAGLESYYISGYCKDIEGNDVGHAWNLVNINDKYYLVDTTILESNMDYIVFSELERQSKKKTSWYDAVLSEILTELDGGLASYYTDPYGYTESIVYGDNIVKVTDDIIYFNQDTSKTIVDVKYEERFKDEIKTFAVSSLLFLGFGYSVSKDKTKLKKMEEE